MHAFGPIMSNATPDDLIRQAEFEGVRPEYLEMMVDAVKLDEIPEVDSDCRPDIFEDFAADVLRSLDRFAEDHLSDNLDADEKLEAIIDALRKLEADVFRKVEAASKKLDDLDTKLGELRGD